MENILRGTSAAITGGADGVGLALARALTRRGVRVALLDIRADAAAEAARMLEAEGGSAIGLTCDVTDAASVSVAAAAVAKDFGELNQLWVNAGVGFVGNLSSMPRADIDWIYAVNVSGAINTVRAFLPLVSATPGFKHIGFTSSSITLGRVPAGPFALYAASKYALLGIAEAIAGEVEPLGIGATIFSPGLLNTRIWDGARARPERFGGPAFQPEGAGELWESVGMSADWAAEAAIKAVERGDAYCAPVDQHSVDDFEACVAGNRAGFVVHRV